MKPSRPLFNEKTALIVIDIQNDYFPEGNFPLFGALEASENAKKLLAWSRDNHHLVLHIQHEAVKKDATFFLKGTKGQQIHSSVLPLPQEKVFTKHEVSAFVGTTLLDHLKEKNIQQLILVGMQTNVCVNGTARDAAKNGFDIVLVQDAIAAKSLDIHQQTISLLEKEVGKLITTDALIGK